MHHISWNTLVLLLKPMEKMSSESCISAVSSSISLSICKKLPFQIFFKIVSKFEFGNFQWLKFKISPAEMTERKEKNGIKTNKP